MWAQKSVSNVVLVVVGQKDGMDRELTNRIQRLSAHVALAGVDEQAVQIVEMNVHNGPPDRTVAK